MNSYKKWDTIIDNPKTDEVVRDYLQRNSGSLSVGRAAEKIRPYLVGDDMVFLTADDNSTYRVSIPEIEII